MNSPLPPATRASKIAVVLPSLEGGGAERSMLNLASAFVAAGREVDLVLCQAKGAYIDQIPEGVRMIELRGAGELRARLHAAAVNPRGFFTLLRPVLLAKKNAPEVASICSLKDYMDQHQPDLILSALSYANLTTLWAQRIADCAIPVIVSERNALATLCATPEKQRKWRWRYLPQLVRRYYPSADAVVTVSSHVADELISQIGLEPASVTTLYNPVVDDSLRERASHNPAHPWFAPGNTPVVLGVGRLAEQKDFPTLIRAFARVRASREARLVILGEGSLRPDLEALALGLGVQDDVDMIGFVENPFQYMARASVMVLSSKYEGLPGVLIQALACGCPVVSTDCPGGSAEILANGKYGNLVGVGDAGGMAQAILSQLDDPTPAGLLLQRAEDFSVDHAASNYLALIDTTLQRAAGSH